MQGERLKSLIRALSSPVQINSYKRKLAVTSAVVVLVHARTNTEDLKVGDKFARDLFFRHLFHQRLCCIVTTLRVFYFAVQILLCLEIRQGFGFYIRHCRTKLQDPIIQMVFANFHYSS